jgi:Rho family, other
VQVAFWDTAGQEDYPRLRPLAYAKSHVIILCLNSKKPIASSAQPLRDKWIPEIRDRCPGIPVILTAVHGDPEEDGCRDCASCGSANVKEDLSRQKFARRIGAAKYLYCDLITGQGINDVFEAVRAFSSLHHSFCNNQHR